MNRDRVFDSVHIRFDSLRGGGEYTNIQSLTPSILREFVDKIAVHEADKSSGKSFTTAMV